MISAVPPCCELVFCQLLLLRTEGGIGLNLPDNFFGAVNIARMPAKRLGQFQLGIKILRLFRRLLFEPFNGRAEKSLGQQFVN